MASKRARRSPTDGGEIEIHSPAVQCIQLQSWMDNQKPLLPRNSVGRPVEKKNHLVDLNVVKDSRPSIFSISTPPAFGRARVSSLRDKCGNCSNNIRRQKIFMYSSMGFCSVECREAQIDYDNKMEKLGWKIWMVGNQS